MENFGENLPNEIENSTQVFLTSEITSKDPEHRKHLRQEIFNKLIKQSFSEKDLAPLSDLNKVPQISNTGLSISHSPAGCAVIIDLTGNLVGIDMEDSSRLNDKLIQRISNPAELEKTPEPSLLFTAKEAAWKALNQNFKIPTISHIETHSWSLDSNWYSFQVSTQNSEIPGKGFSRRFKHFDLSFFITLSTFGEKHRQR